MDINERRISIWGDSILKGIVLDNGSGTYRVLDGNCVSRFAEATGKEISNHASFGMTVGKALERIKRSVERNPPEGGDIVLVEFGGNDCDYDWKEISANPRAHHEPKTPLPAFIEKLGEIIGIFRSLGTTPVLMSLPPLVSERYFEWISKNLNGDNILEWLGDVNKIYRWQEAYNDVVVETARKNGLPLVNIRKEFLVNDRCNGLFCADGIHPNADGHDVIYNAFIKYVS